MPWIDDVVTHTTIRSVWGNTIRDHVVQVFTNRSERDTNAAKMIEGDLCYVVTEKALYVRRPSAAQGFGTLFSDWANYTPIVVVGAYNPTLTANYSKWRLVGARRVEYVTQFVATVPPGVPGGCQFSVPIASAADIGAAGAAVGSGSISASGSSSRIFGQVRLSNTGYMAVRIPADDSIWGPGNAGGQVTCYAETAYEVSDQ